MRGAQTWVGTRGPKKGSQAVGGEVWRGKSVATAQCVGMGVGRLGSGGADGHRFAIIGNFGLDREVGMEMEKLDKLCAVYLKENQTPKRTVDKYFVIAPFWRVQRALSLGAFTRRI